MRVRPVGTEGGCCPVPPSQCWGLGAWCHPAAAARHFLTLFYSFLGFVKPSALQLAAELLFWWAGRYSWHFLEHTLVSHIFISLPRFALYLCCAEAFAVRMLVLLRAFFGLFLNLLVRFIVQTVKVFLKLILFVNVHTSVPGLDGIVCTGKAKSSYNSIFYAINLLNLFSIQNLFTKFTILVIKKVTFLFECMAGFICKSVMIVKKDFMCLCIFVPASNKTNDLPWTLSLLYVALGAGPSLPPAASTGGWS